MYVGTDVGVFATSSDVANWTELDPPAGQPGFLPGVAVTALRIFDAGGLKRLRAATYGRGIWEWNLITTPDFQLSVTNNPQTVFAGSNAVFKGSISAINGYNSSVNLSCVAGGTPAPQTCLVTPPSVSPDAAGTVFTVSGADAPGDYSFNVQAAGTDAQATTHTFALTMHVIDFNLSVPTPSTVMLVRGASSTPVSFTVSAAGAFNAVVALSCSGLPQGTDCQFQPSSSVTPTSGNPVAVTLIVSSQASTPVGSSQVQIEASAANGPSKTQPLTLDLAAAADYLLAISNPSVTTHVNSPPATFQGTITALNGYNGTITLTCGAGAPPTCQANPPTLIPSSAGTPFTVTVASGASQNFIFSINAVGSDGLAISHSVPVSLSVLPAQNFDFTMGVDPQSASVPDGQATTYMLDVNPGAANFPDAVTFACANLPQFATCSFNPTQVGAGTGNATVAMTIATVAPSGRTNGRFAATLIFAFPVAGFFWIGLRDGARKRAKTARILLGIVLALFSTSCGGGLQGNGVVGGSGIGTPGTPKGTYNVTITANAGSVSHSTKVSLTVQ